MMNIMSTVSPTSLFSTRQVPGVPLPSWADEIISDAISSPLPPTIMSSLPNEVDTVPYSEPQPCSSFWYADNYYYFT